MKEEKTEEELKETVQEAPETEQNTPEEEKEPTIEEQLEAANAEIVSLKDQLLRKIAEFDNYRKRTIKEKTDLILNGGEKTIVSILPVIDDMERALKNMQKAEDVSAVLEGVELIYKKFIDILGKQGVSVIETKEADFDVDVHEAVAQLPAPTPELKGKVMDCTLTGYKLNEKVIRHVEDAFSQGNLNMLCLLFFLRHIRHPLSPQTVAAHAAGNLIGHIYQKETHYGIKESNRC
ncbi:MAG: nucleotide exchange factor GrpE [Bacteroidaceae bacterium]|nr:nucleotide exchange factor GrpE [Bacteroidaceae bacterium]